jgi:hypothetical protein
MIEDKMVFKAGSVDLVFHMCLSASRMDFYYGFQGCFNAD